MGFFAPEDVSENELQSLIRQAEYGFIGTRTRLIFGSNFNSNSAFRALEEEKRMLSELLFKEFMVSTKKVSKSYEKRQTRHNSYERKARRGPKRNVRINQPKK